MSDHEPSGEATVSAGPRSKRSRVVLADRNFDDLTAEVSILEAAGLELVDAGRMSADERRNALTNADAILVQRALLSRGLLESLTQCRAIVQYGIGVDTIDVDAARDLGIDVANVPDYCVEEVSDQTIAFVLLLARDLQYVWARVRAGEWPRPVRPVKPISDLALGLVGFGRIGRAVAQKALALRMHVSVCDPFIADGELLACGVAPQSLEGLLSTSDVVSLHVPATRESLHLMNARTLALMKPGARLVNCSRGSLVDTSALVDALHSGALAGAALDVLDHEPPPADDPIRQVERLMLTSHTAWYSDQAVERLHRMAAEEVVRAFSPGGMKNIVNRRRAES